MGGSGWNENVPLSMKVYATVLGLMTVLLISFACVNMVGYDEDKLESRRLPPPRGDGRQLHGDAHAASTFETLPWWFMCILDYGWFTVVSFMPRFRPRSFGPRKLLSIHYALADHPNWQPHRFGPFPLPGASLGDADSLPAEKKTQEDAVLQDLCQKFTDMYHRNFLNCPVVGGVQSSEESHAQHPEEPFSVGLTVTDDFEGLRVHMILDPLKVNSVLPEKYRTGLFMDKHVGKRFPGIVRLNVTEHGAVRVSLRLYLDAEADVEDCMKRETPCFDLLLAEMFKTFPCKTAENLLNIMHLQGASCCGAMQALTPCSRRARTRLGDLNRTRRLISDLDFEKGVMGKEYYGGAPYKLGPDSAFRMGLRPRQSHKQDTTELGIVDLGRLAQPDREGLRKLRAAYNQGLKQYFERKPDGKAVFDFVIQPSKHASMVGVVNSEWDERLSPYVSVGKVEIFGGQCTGAKTTLLACPTQFSAWNVFPEHEPLGTIGRARKAVYHAHSTARLLKARKTNKNDEVTPDTCLRFG
eukprot:TRINITY_DN112280_c0_g1_i1.p1 TRINITY_DN112280_c0_g1~~TRINITY_DN112280_c0_g1_i1.p1  ORF type:complete len:525 (+),score=30.63 TRINITY_DN112280_c0_g1_i1:729-2303(+)